MRQHGVTIADGTIADTTVEEQPFSPASGFRRREGWKCGDGRNVAKDRTLTG